MSQTAPEPQSAEAAPPQSVEVAPPQSAPPQSPSAAQAPPAQAYVAAPQTQGRVLPKRSPMLAAVLSALPGFGNVYNGLFSRGLLTFLVFFGFLFIAQENHNGPEMALLVPGMIFTWLFGVVDAYRNATLINMGVTEVDLQNQIPDIKAPSGGLAVGVALFLIGLYGFLTEAMELDVSVIFDYWYVILMGIGGWLSYHGYQSKKGNGADSEL